MLLSFSILVYSEITIADKDKKYKIVQAKKEENQFSSAENPYF